MRVNRELNRAPLHHSKHAVWTRIRQFLSLKAPTTALTYRGVIDEWCRFLKAPPHSDEAAVKILAATDLHALAFRAFLEKQPGERPRSERRESSRREVLIANHRDRRKKEGLEATLSNATVAKKFAVLRRVYRMLMGSFPEISLNPFDSDRVPPPPKHSGRKRPTEMVDFKLVKKIIGGADASTAKGLRDKALLSILFGGALRSSEAAALTVGDVRRSSAGTIFLYLRATKAKKDAAQPLPRWAAEPLLQLLQERSKQRARADDPLFVSFSGKAGISPTRKRLPSSGVYNVFKHYCFKAGAGRFVSPHSARATAITRLLAEGVPHRKVQEFSRHSSIQMVELYDKRRIGVDENAGKSLDFE